MSGSKWQEEQWKSPFEKQNYVVKRQHNRTKGYNGQPKTFEPDHYGTDKCCYCHQRMSRYYRHDWQNGGWLRKAGFFQGCFNQDCPLQTANIIGSHKEYGHSYKFSLT